jgi:phenylalanine-4-hydroxylase
MSTGKRALIFSITDRVGGLQEALSLIKKHNLNMVRIESRPSKDERWDYDFFVDFQDVDNDSFNNLLEELNEKGFGISTFPLGKSLSSSNLASVQVPWFPRKISDLDEFSNKVMEYGAELSSNHPGFTDEVYRKRRKEITAIASAYKHGEKIPTVNYTQEEISTWRVVYNELKNLFPTHACKQLNYVFPLLEQNCGYSPDNIPQLEDVSRFLQECTGWRLRPVKGLLTSRDFLNGLAFRVFHSTQYIRHFSAPLYTPEPDVCHELIGHVPLFADPDFADFSQEIGLASLGASDQDIEKLSTCYWFTVEFGLCREDGKIKAYGAGLLSSFGELKYCIGGSEKKPQYLEFDPFEASKHQYPITEYQPTYYVARSFQDAKEKLTQFSKTLDRPFTLRYNPYTQGIELLDTTLKMIRVIKDIQTQLSSIQSALSDLSSNPRPITVTKESRPNNQ